MITSYIQELLTTNNRVIIPNYGAFLVRATSKGKDSNNLQEKLSDIYFSPFLKFNDELLERFIVKKEGVTKDQASNKIKEFIEQVKTTLNNESAFEIKDFGLFTMDKQGKVVFTPFVNDLAAKVSDQPKEPIKKETKKTTTKTVKEPAKKTTTKSKLTKTEEKEIPVEIKQEEQLIIKEEIKETPKIEEKPISKTELKATTVQSQKVIDKKMPSKKPSTLNKGLVWSIALGLPLAAIFVWAILNLDTINKILNNNKKQEAKIEKATPEKTVKENTTIINPEAQPEQNIQQSTNTAPQKSITSAEVQKKYYIIAGSFKNQQYADNYQRSLKEKGFPAERLAERNGMYAVSYNSFTDKTQALAEYKVITREKGLTAWILYY